MFVQRSVEYILATGALNAHLKPTEKENKTNVSHLKHFKRQILTEKVFEIDLNTKKSKSFDLSDKEI
ncbi:MAG: hypothetical protein H6619_05705 [Deltaproteobacteria bacterium]|nr:hypothetical protein [Deltaproteobacteria bacterium]